MRGEQHGYNPEKPQTGDREAAQMRLVLEHRQFKPDADRQDLFALNEAALDRLRMQVPQIDFEDSARLKQIDAGAVVFEEKKGGFRTFGVVYEETPPYSYALPEKKVRSLYSVVENKKGAPERRWYKWEKDPKNPKASKMGIVEIKALAYKKEARGGAVVDAVAHWKILRSDNALIGVEETKHFNGDEDLIRITADAAGRVQRVEKTHHEKAGETREVQDFTEAGSFASARQQIFKDGNLQKAPANYIDRRDAESLLSTMQQMPYRDPNDIRFKHGSYYQNENED